MSEKLANNGIITWQHVYTKYFTQQNYLVNYSAPAEKNACFNSYLQTANGIAKLVVKQWQTNAPADYSFTLDNKLLKCRELSGRICSKNFHRCCQLSSLQILQYNRKSECTTSWSSYAVNNQQKMFAGICQHFSNVTVPLAISFNNVLTYVQHIIFFIY